MAVSESIVQSRRALYVGGLGENVSQATLRAAFIPFGSLKTIDMPMDYQKGVHKGFAFVEYQDPDDAAEAIFNMDGAELMGRTLKVSLAQPNQLSSLSNTKAVWSTDEWFQQQAGLDNKEDQEEKTAKEHDVTALKEQQAMH